jgi:hypothetical protein
MERSTAWVLGLVLYMLGMLQYVVGPIAGDIHRITGSLGDARLTGFILEHGWRWLCGDVSRYWDAPFFYPAPNTMAYSETHLGSLPIYAVLRLVGLDRWGALEGWIALLFTANYLSACFFLRRFRFDARAIPIGAYLFAFSLPYAGQLDHLAVVNVAFVPAVFYFLLTWLETLDHGSFLGLAVSFAGLTLCWIYAAYLTALVGALLVIVYVVTNWSALMGRVQTLRLWNVTWQVACLCAVAGVLVPYGYRYWQASASFGGRSVTEVAEFIPRPLSLLLVPDSAIVWHVSSGLGPKLPARWEHALFPGGLATISLLAALVFTRGGDRRVRAAALAVVCSILLFLFWTPTFSPYLWLVQHLRFLLGIRAVSRVIFVELFLFSICLTWLTSTAVDRIRSRWLRAWTIVLIAIALVLDVSVDPRGISFSVAEAKKRSERVVKAVRAAGLRNVTPFAWWPPVGDDEVPWIHIDAMIAAQELLVATVNGYSGVWPAGYPFDVREGRGKLRGWFEIARERYHVDPAGILVVP